MFPSYWLNPTCKFIPFLYSMIVYGQSLIGLTFNIYLGYNVPPHCRHSHNQRSTKVYFMPLRHKSQPFYFAQKVQWFLYLCGACPFTPNVMVLTPKLSVSDVRFNSFRSSVSFCLDILENMGNCGKFSTI